MFLYCFRNYGMCLLLTKKFSDGQALDFYKEYSSIRELLVDSFKDDMLYYQKLVYSQQIIFNLFVISFLLENGIIRKENGKNVNKEKFFVELLKSNSFFSEFYEISSFCRTYTTNRIFTILNQKYEIPFFHTDFFILLSELDKNSISVSSSSLERILNYIINFSTNPDFSFDLFGIIFEQDLALLETIKKEEIDVNQETKILAKLTERRKKGIFYTPKTITEYICRKTVHSYLSEHIDIKDKKLESAIAKMKKSELSKFYELITEIKILDPTCGAGNFLLEICELLFNLRKEVLLKTNGKFNAFNHKNEILRSNIFGIDIQNIAISITSLRLWLWLLEDYTVTTNETNGNLLPDLIPNLQIGNSLIGFSYEKIIQLEEDYKINSETRELIIEAQKELLGIPQEDENNDVLNAFTTISDMLKTSSSEQKIFTNFDLLISTYGNLQTCLRKKNVDYKTRSKLNSLYVQIRKLLYDNINKNFLKFLHNKIKHSTLNLEDIEFLNPFHWRVDFADILNDGGFDIIVGNPPYLENKKLRNLIEKKILKVLYKSAYKLYDLSILFIERSHILLKEKGLFSFIITNKFISTDYGIRIRKLILKETRMKEIIDVSYLPIFKDAATYPIILTFAKASTTLDIKNLENKFLIIPKLDELKLLKTEQYKKIKAKQSDYYNLPKHVFDLTGNFPIINEIINSPDSVKLSDLGKFSYRILGFTDWGKSLDLISDKRKSEKDLKFIGTTNVFQYYINWKKIIKLGGKRFESSYLNYNKEWEVAWKTFRKEKILIKEISKKLTASYDPGLFANATGIYMFLPENVKDTKILTLMLNSDLLNFFFTTLFGSTHMAGGYLRFNGSYLNELPIVIPKTGYQKILLSFLCEYLSFLEYRVIENNTRSKIHEFFFKLVNYLILELYFGKEFEKSLFDEIKGKVVPFNFDRWLKLHLNSKRNTEYQVRTDGMISSILVTYNMIHKNTEIIMDSLQKNKKLTHILSN